AVPVRPLTSSATSGLRFWGSMLEPVAQASGSRTQPRPAHRATSLASREAWGGAAGRGVERERRAGDRPGPQRADVGPAARVLETADVPGQGEAVGGELEGPQHRPGRAGGAHGA